MNRFIGYLQSGEDSDHLLVKGAMAHLNLVMIHPFSDGNGRMARCLQTLVLAGAGVAEPQFSSIEEYLGRNTQAYYDVLATTGQGKWGPHGNTLEWIRFTLTAHSRQAATVVSRKRMISKLWDNLEIQLKKHKLPDRLIFALSDAAMGYHVRSSHYRTVADVSNVVSSRDLKAAVDAGLLVPTGERRGRMYGASNELKELYVKIRSEEMKLIPDPFETAGELITA